MNFVLQCFLASYLLITISVCQDEAYVFHKLPLLPVVRNPGTVNVTVYDTDAMQPKIDSIPTGVETQFENAGQRNVSVVISSFIINGQPAVPGQFPWQAAIIQDFSSFCGGSLIAPNLVLTAAHCAVRIKKFVIHCGVIKYTDTANRLSYEATSKTTIVHENYHPRFLTNDIAVIRLTTSIPSTHFTSGKVNIVRLPSIQQASETFVGTVGTVSGWGRISDTSGVQPTLNFVQLPVISNAECARTFGTNVVKATTLCTSGTTGKNICNGDSGGPFVFEEPDKKVTQIGIVSFGSSMGCTKAHPAGYTRVASYLGWISNKTSVRRE